MSSFIVEKMNFDKKTIAGLLLLFGILAIMMWLNQPSQSEMAREKRMQDSITNALLLRDSSQLALRRQADSAKAAIATLPAATADSVLQRDFSAEYGDFYPAATGKNEDIVLENVC